MMDDRKNLPVLEARRKELLAEIEEVSNALKEAESVVLEMEKEVLQETSDLTQEKIDHYISKNITPLKVQREQCRDLIAMYTDSIARVKKFEKENSDRIDKG